MYQESAGQSEPRTYAAALQSPVGPLHIVADDSCLLSITITERTLPHRAGQDRLECHRHTPIAKALQQLTEFFAGLRREFQLPLRPGGTAFQQAVWGELLRIPFGETISYSELARRIGNPRAVRAVGLATGRNPLAIIVPCHRVIGMNGKLTGYRAGLPRKRLLLQFEGSMHSPATASALR